MLSHEVTESMPGHTLCVHRVSHAGYGCYSVPMHNTRRTTYLRSATQLPAKVMINEHAARMTSNGNSAVSTMESCHEKYQVPVYGFPGGPATAPPPPQAPPQG